MESHLFHARVAPPTVDDVWSSTPKTSDEAAESYTLVSSQAQQHLTGERANTTSQPARRSDHTVKRSNKGSRKGIDSDDDQPLLDTTAILPLRSKKLERMQKRQQKKSQRTKVHSDVKSFLDLPSELLSEVLGHLRPSDILALGQVNHATREFILDHETSIARDIIRTRYWILSRCFQLPVPANQLDPTKHSALLSPRWQANIGAAAHNRNPYQHVRRVDPQVACCCSTCHLAWNNLCMILDLAHWQPLLNNREPIPKVERGRYPEWNTKLLDHNAAVVERAMYNPLIYARILESHLNTITGTILRFAKYRRKGAAPPPRLFEMTDREAAAGTDAFLVRSGPPSYDFPFWRDSYYSLGAYVPNRKWSKEEQKWHYPPPPPKQHDFDLDWASKWFRQDPELEQRMDQYVERLRQKLAR